MCVRLRCRSELAQKVGANGLAENVQAFNTNYNDAGLFGVYATAKVRIRISSERF
jgi:predicted Zn-dependent peptidase